MFGDVVQTSIKLGSQKWYTVPLSIIAHVVLFGAIIIIPLMATDVLPTPQTMMAFAAPPPPPPPTPPPPPAAAAPPKVTPTPVTNPNAAPTEAPKEIVPEPPATTGVSTGVPGGVEGGIPGGTLGGVVGGLPEAPPPPPPPPTAPVRVGGNIRAPTRVKNVNPIYPPIAQSARVSGIVIIEATIGP